MKAAPWKRLAGILIPLYPVLKPQLRFGNPFELAVAVILSAQCTDDRVNETTPALFSRWPDPRALAAADREELEAVLRPLGFFRAKARFLTEMSISLLENHGGKIPEGMNELTALMGIGPKSAHLIRSACFGKPGIIVDTHVSRLSQRYGASPDRDPGRIERAIAAAIPEKEWTDFSHAMNRHGKYVCLARSPHCEVCALFSTCAFSGKIARRA